MKATYIIPHIKVLTIAIDNILAGSDGPGAGIDPPTVGSPKNEAPSVSPSAVNVWNEDDRNTDDEGRRAW